MRIDVTIRIVFNDDNIEYVPQYKYDNTTIRYNEYKVEYQINDDIISIC